MEWISLAVHAYIFVNIYEALTEKRQKSVRYVIILLFCLVKYRSGDVYNFSYFNYLEPVVLCSLLIVYGVVIYRKGFALNHVTYAVVTFSLDCVFNIMIGSAVGFLMSLIQNRNTTWLYVVVIMCRCLLLWFFVRQKKTVIRMKQSWVFSIVKVTAVIILIIEQVLCFSYSASDLNYGVIAIACMFLASLYTIFWLIDHRKMVRIQNIYAADNRQMSQKLHRSKEILPAIANYVSNMDQEPDEELRKKLEAVCHDYGKELGGRELSADLFETTGVALVDLLLRTKILECDKQDIELDVFVNAQIDKALRQVDMSEGELARMLGDLIQNAVHALEPVREKMILLLIAMDESQHILIQIYDSGILFSPEILAHFGERGRTTWGTGNGLADMMETLERAGASLEICQNMQGRDVFTKSISICFDGRGAVQIESSK